MNGTGLRFKKIRQALNLSQSDFGEKLGLTSQGISNVEKEKSFLSLNSLQKLLNLGVNLNYLIGEQGEMFIFNKTSDDYDFKSKVKEVLIEEGLLKV